MSAATTHPENPSAAEMLPFGSKKKRTDASNKPNDSHRRHTILSGVTGRAVVIDYSTKGKEDLTQGVFYTDLPQAFKNVHLHRDFHAMDQKLLEALGATFKQFSIGRTAERLFHDMSWDALTEAFSTSHYFSPQQGNILAKKNEAFTAYNDQLHRSFRNFLQKSEKIVEKHMMASKGKVIQDAKAWFASFVDDPDVSDSIQLNFSEIAERIAKFQKPVEGPDGRPISRDQNDQHEEVFLDIGVLRFPDFEKPYIKVYRLKLIAWTEYNVRTMLIRSGIRGEFNSCNYVPRKEFLATFQPQILEEARKFAMELLSGPSPAS